MSLTIFNNDGLELVIDVRNGAAFATQAGYCRMSGKAKQTISDRMEKFDPVRSDTIETAEILIGQGFDPVRSDTIETASIDTGKGIRTVKLIPASLVFKWLLKDNPELAEKMGACGATVFLHQLAGYKIQSTAVSYDLTSLVNLLENVNNQLVEQQNQLRLLHERTQRLDILEEENKELSTELDNTKDTLNLINEAGESHPGCQNIIKQQIIQPKQKWLTAYEFLIENNYSLSKLHTLARRAAVLYRTSKKEEPPRNYEGSLIFEESYLNEVYKTL